MQSVNLNWTITTLLIVLVNQGAQGDRQYLTTLIFGSAHRNKTSHAMLGYPYLALHHFPRAPSGIQHTVYSYQPSPLWNTVSSAPATLGHRLLPALLHTSHHHTLLWSVEVSGATERLTATPSLPHTHTRYRWQMNSHSIPESCGLGRTPPASSEVQGRSGQLPCLLWHRAACVDCLTA